MKEKGLESHRNDDHERAEKLLALAMRKLLDSTGNQAVRPSMGGGGHNH